MSFASLRRLRRRFGISNAAKVAEARRYLHDELADRVGPHRGGSPSAHTLTTLRAAGFDSDLGREVRWATSLGERVRNSTEPSDDEVDRFFDALERLYGADLSAPVEARDLIGRVVGDRYAVEALIGEGAAGVVYRARHVETAAAVAVKILHPSKVLRREIIGELDHPKKFWDELVARFRREARAAANLSHPGIVSVFDFGAEGAGFYQAMEFLEGETLKDVLAREAPMPVDRALKLAHQAASALDAAHARGVIHRDLKPANLFLCRFDWGEQLKVLDFGIAKMVREAEEEATRLTETGVFLGTYRYASPEQCLGDRITTASDVYSLGVILFEMLAGRPPFDGPSSVLAIRHATAPPPRLDEFRPDLPEGLVEIVDRCLAKVASNRPARGGDLAAALAALLGQGVPVAPPVTSRRPRRTIPADAFAPPSGTEHAASARAPSPSPAPHPTAHAHVSLSRGPRDFAMLLVDELLQFFPEAVAQGRASGDIYRRLHNEIDVRWSLHAGRFPNEAVDHFYELLVERIAGGDPGRFGPGMPDSTTQRRRRRKR
jgi:serine/threonine protein kinase